MACSGSCKCINRHSCVGYTYITNNVAQTVATNQLVSPGSVVRTSCIGTIVPTGNNSLTVNKTGTYLISVQLIGTATSSGTQTPPEAAFAEAVAVPTQTIQPTILINGLAVSSPVVSASTSESAKVYEVRVISPLCCGDIITISNLGSLILSMPASNTQGGYNVNIIIERFN